MSKPVFQKARIDSGAIIKHRYLVKQLLGQGELGRTYLAWDTHRFNEPCVLKEFAPTGARQFDLAKSAELFTREAKILYHLNHPQIPRFMAYFEEQERLFLAQEYIQGKSYSALISANQEKKRTFQESNVICWLLNLLPVLEYIHQHHILHRDISPDNIIQPQNNQAPVLIDFSVGKFTSSTTIDSSDVNPQDRLGNKSFVGKIGYAPREQVTMGICSPSSDLYSLGVTALVLLTGKQPTQLLDRYSLNWKWEQYAQVSSPLQAILHKMTAEQPQQRYQSARGVIKDIENNIINRNTFIYSAASNCKSQSVAGKQLQPETMIISQINAQAKSSPAANSSTPKQVPTKKGETMIISNIKGASSQSPQRKPRGNDSRVISPTGTRLVDFPDSPKKSAKTQKPKPKGAASSQVPDDTMIVTPPKMKDD